MTQMENANSALGLGKLYSIDCYQPEMYPGDIQDLQTLSLKDRHARENQITVRQPCFRAGPRSCTSFHCRAGTAVADVSKFSCTLLQQVSTTQQQTRSLLCDQSGKDELWKVLQRTRCFHSHGQFKAFTARSMCTRLRFFSRSNSHHNA